MRQKLHWVPISILDLNRPGEFCLCSYAFAITEEEHAWTGLMISRGG